MLFHKGLTSFLLIRIQMLLKQQTKPVPVQTVDVSNYIKKNRFHLNQDNKLNKKRLYCITARRYTSILLHYYAVLLV